MRPWRPALAVFVGVAMQALAGCGAAQDPRPTVIGGIGLVGGGGAPMPISRLSAAGEFLVGNFALEHGDVREAGRAFRRALRSEPDNLELRRRVFVLTLAGGDLDQALDEARILVEIDPEADEAQLLIALDAVRQGRFEAASARFARIPRAGIVGVVLPVLDAWATAAAGDTEEALRLLTQSARGEIAGSLYAYHRAMLVADLGRIDEAIEALADLMDGPGLVPTRMVQAKAGLLARSGRHDEALALVDRHDRGQDGSLVLAELRRRLDAGETPPPPIADPIGGMADALLGLAEALERQRAGGQAIIYARLAALLDPELAEAWLLLADVFAEQDNHAEAVAALERVPATDPLGWDARLQTARLLHAQGRTDEAFALLEAMAAERARRIDTLVTLGDLLRRDEDYAAAERAYSRAIERIESIEESHWPLLYARGITYERTQRWPEAEADFLSALELEPEQPYVLNYLAYSWVDQGLHLDRALPMLERAVELRPNDGFIVDSLGWVHYRLGNYHEAVRHLERAVELQPGDPILNDHLGDAYWRVGRQREARFQWQRALTLDPETDSIAEIETKLEHGLRERAAHNTSE